MHAITWTKGSNLEMDQLFDQLREIRYQDQSHKLWKNYSKEEIEIYSGVVAYTICFADNGTPEMCSTISSRTCWPVGCYRILNRLWKHSNKINYPVVMSPSFAVSAQSQIDWLRENTDCKLYFISRQKDNWERWCIRMFKNKYQISFQTDNFKYLTCPNECDDTCWQKIIYNGDQEILNLWKRVP
jgi:hypothetical protein